MTSLDGEETKGVEADAEEKIELQKPKSKHIRSEKQKQQLIDARAKRDAAARVKEAKIKEIKNKPIDDILAPEPVAPVAAEPVVAEIKQKRVEVEDSDDDIVIVKKKRRKPRVIYLEQSDDDEEAPVVRKKVSDKREYVVGVPTALPVLRFI